MLVDILLNATPRLVKQGVLDVRITSHGKSFRPDGLLDQDKQGLSGNNARLTPTSRRGAGEFVTELAEEYSE